MTALTFLCFSPCVFYQPSLCALTCFWHVCVFFSQQEGLHCCTRPQRSPLEDLLRSSRYPGIRVRTSRELATSLTTQTVGICEKFISHIGYRELVPHKFPTSCDGSEKSNESIYSNENQELKCRVFSENHKHVFSRAEKLSFVLKKRSFKKGISFFLKSFFPSENILEVFLAIKEFRNRPF